jgi:hypothetical protein
MDASCTLSAYATSGWRFAKIDKRTRQWRRRSELISLYREQLDGQLSGTNALDVERLADSVVLAETTRAKMLAGEPVDVFGLARLENTVSRMLWALGLGRRRRQDLGPTLAEVVGAGK